MDYLPFEIFWKEETKIKCISKLYLNFHLVYMDLNDYDYIDFYNTGTIPYSYL